MTRPPPGPIVAQPSSLVTRPAQSGLGPAPVGGMNPRGSTPMMAAGRPLAQSVRPVTFGSRLNLAPQTSSLIQATRAFVLVSSSLMSRPTTGRTPSVRRTFGETVVSGNGLSSPERSVVYVDENAAAATLEMVEECSASWNATSLGNDPAQSPVFSLHERSSTMDAGFW